MLPSSQITNNNILLQLLTSSPRTIQVFAFCVVTVNNEHTKPRFTRKCRC